MKNDVYGRNGEVITQLFNLPSGYFYKGKFYKTVASLFNVLKKEGIAGSYSYPNGVWVYNDIWYASLKELHEWNEDKLGVAYEYFVHCYEEYGVTHSCVNCTMYYCSEETPHDLFNDKEEAINDYVYNFSNPKILNESEYVEEDYLQTLSDDELIEYSKKSFKQRISVLEQWLGSNLYEKK